MSAPAYERHRPDVPVDPPGVESYAERAIERWQAEGRRELRGAFSRHDPRACDCVSCADGREALGLIALTPLWARRRWPDGGAP